MIPYSTDAPVYHWPVATVGLIAANVAVLVAVMTLEDPVAGPPVTCSSTARGSIPPSGSRRTSSTPV